MLIWMFWGVGSHAIQTPALAAERPGPDEGRRHVADLWAESGWRLVEAGEYRRAAQAFAVARELNPKQAAYWVGFGLSQVRRYRDDLALPALERAIEIDPSMTQAHVLLGDIYAQRGDVMAAARYYDTAFRQDPNHVGVRERLLLARRDEAYEAAFDRLFSAHFIVKFQGATDRAVAGRITERLEVVYDEIGRLLGYFPDEPFMVLLHPKRQFQAATLSPGWTNALFDGRIHLPLERVAPVLDGPTGERQEREQSHEQLREIDRMLKNEYAHALVHRLSGGRAPAWLSEGLALYCEGKNGLAGDRQAGRTAGQAARESLSALHESWLGLSPRAAAQAYEDSFQATQTLIRQHGLLRVRQLLEALTDERDFPRAFEALFHERYRDFDEARTSSRAGWRGGERG
jgi:tetratricopeptide (TPR) repeat protein